MSIREWPFDDPPNLATYTTKAIMKGDDWIAWVFHDEDDGTWQFLGPDGAPDDLDEAMLVGLHHLLEKDPTVSEVADLPLGWQAWRDGRDEPWQRSPRVN